MMQRGSFLCALLMGSAATLLSTAGSARAAVDAYITQTTNMNAVLAEKNDSPPFTGTFDNGDELGQYANNGSEGSTPGSAAFRTLTASGGNRGATARTLRHGDTFTITAYAGSNPAAGGFLGFSFRDSTTYTGVLSAVDETAEVRFQLDDAGGWKLYHNGGSEDSSLAPGTDRTFSITPTSANSFNATIGGVTYYDLQMAAGGGAIDSLAIYTYGNNNPDSYWKNATLENTGVILLGAGNDSKTVPGVIDDGRLATSASTVSSNLVIKAGTGTFTMTNVNTYSGGTIISNGTLVIGAGGRPGAASTGGILVQTNTILRFDRNDTFGPGGADYSTVFTVQGGTITNGGNFFNTMGPIVLDGGTLGSGGGFNVGFPAFYLRKSVTVLANAQPSRITSGGSNGGYSLYSNTVFDVQDGAADDDLIFSGNLINGTALAAITKIGAGKMVLSGVNTYNGTNLVYGGTFTHNGTNTAASTVVASNAVIAGLGRIQALAVREGGILSPGHASRGTLTASTSSWEAASSYRWEVRDFAGLAGTDNGSDLFRCLGPLSITATAGNAFTVRVVSVTSGGTPGAADNFTGSATTQILAHAQSVVGFATNLFALDFTGFSNAFSGTWSIALLANTNVALVYAPPPGELDVLGINGAVINHGDATPATLDGTDFGSLDLTGSGLTHTFTITNPAAGSLSLTGAPLVQISGPQAGDFVVTTQPAAAITNGAATTFSIRFSPLATGLRQATVSIYSSDADESPYTFALQGTGAFDAADFPSKVQIQFCGYDRAETLANFPVLLALGTGITNFDYNTFLSGSGGDLRFTDNSQTQLLNYEIERWDPAGTSYVWVQLPALNSATTTIWAYWGNAAAATAPATTTNGATWSDQFAGVWHLEETAGDSRDSSPYGLTGVPSNDVTQAEGGQIAGGDNFGGLASRTFIGSPAVLNNLTNNFTVTSWIRPDVLGGNRIIFGANWAGFNGWSLRLNGAQLALERLPGGALNAGVTVTASQWAAVAAVYDTANNATFYINGEYVGLATGLTAAAVATQPWSLGANSGDHFDGIIDEVQVSQVARSSNWIWAAYQSTRSNSNFACFGTVDSGAPPSNDNDGDGLPNDWETQYGLNPNASNAPNANADGDWMTDLQEYIADTVPTNGASVFPQATLTNAPLGTMNLVVPTTSTGRVYGVVWTTNLLLQPQAWTLYPPEKTGTASALIFTVTNDAPGRTYRTSVRLP